jgi:hypothetical protein
MWQPSNQPTTISIPPSAYHHQHTTISLPPSAYHHQHTTISIPPSAYHHQHIIHHSWAARWVLTLYKQVKVLSCVAAVCKCKLRAQLCKLPSTCMNEEVKHTRNLLQAVRCFLHHGFCALALIISASRQLQPYVHPKTRRVQICSAAGAGYNSTK